MLAPSLRPFCIEREGEREGERERGREGEREREREGEREGCYRLKTDKVAERNESKGSFLNCKVDLKL